MSIIAKAAISTLRRYLKDKAAPLLILQGRGSTYRQEVSISERDLLRHLRNDYDLESMWNRLCETPSDIGLCGIIRDRLEELDWLASNGDITAPPHTGAREIYQVGPDTMTFPETESISYEWCVYYYEVISDYEGSGEAWGYCRERGIKGINLGHCSCNDPVEDWCLVGKSVDWISPSNFRILYTSPASVIGAEIRPECLVKILELLDS